MSIARIAAIAAALSLAGQAIAAPPAPSPLGVWEFKTGEIVSCTISGTMTVSKPATGGGAYPCRFESVQSCPSAVPPASYKVAQTCTAQVVDNHVVIKSKVDHIVKVTPEFALDGVKNGYAPDDFTVEINKDATEMKGVFYSHGQAKVTFWRPKDLTS